MSLQTKTADEIIHAIKQQVCADKSIEGPLGDFPYLSVQALHWVHHPDAVNWTLEVAGAYTPAMAAAIQRAKETIQAEMRLAVSPLGSSAYGG